MRSPSKPVARNSPSTALRDREAIFIDEIVARATLCVAGRVTGTPVPSHNCDYTGFVRQRGTVRARVRLETVRRLDATRPTSALRWLPPLAWALLILSLSMLPEMYFGTPSTRQGRRVHFYLEVLVHITQFCVFFVLMARALRPTLRSRAWTLAGAFAAVLVLSLTNESLQTLTPTRTFDVADMTMDVLGGFIGFGVSWFLGRADR